MVSCFGFPVSRGGLLLLLLLVEIDESFKFITGCEMRDADAGRPTRFQLKQSILFVNEL